MQKYVIVVQVENLFLHILISLRILILSLSNFTILKLTISTFHISTERLPL